MANEKENSFLRWLSRPESLVGLSAVVISIVAVAVSAYEARIMREWQRAAVWPYVQLSRSFFYDRELYEQTGERGWRLLFEARNVGVGPASVKGFRVTVNGEPHTNWRSAINAVLADEPSFEYGQSGINGAIIPADASIQMFQLSDSPLAKQIYDNMDALNFEACFCSVFNECWRTSWNDFGASEPIAECKAEDWNFEE